MRALFDHDEVVARFVGQFIPGGHRGFGECRSIGFLDRQGRLEAGVVYHNWSPEARVIEMTAASVHRRWVTRERLRAIFGLPFAMGARLAVARTAEGNAVVRRIFRTIGAKEYVIPGLRADGEAEIVLTLDAEAWRRNRLSGDDNGQAERAEAA